MNRRFVLVLSVVAVLAVVAGLVVGRRLARIATVGAERARVGFDPPVIELGEQLWGEIVDVPLHFANEGEVSVEVASVESSCGCMVIAQEAYVGQVIKPGNTFPVDVVLDTETNPGQKRRQVTLRDSTGERYTAAIQLTVRGTWELSTDELDFGKVGLDKGKLLPLDRIVEFVSESDSMVGAPIVRASWLECLVSDDEESPRKILFRAYPDRLTPGRHVTSVVIRTDNSIKPDATIFVRVTGTRQLTPSPQHVFLVGSEPSLATFYDALGRQVRLVAADAGTALVSVSLTDDGSLRVQNERAASINGEIVVQVVAEGGLNGQVAVSTFE